MRAGLAGVTAEGAVAAVIATKIGERKENFARIGDEIAFEALSGRGCGGEQGRKFIIGASDQGVGLLAGKRHERIEMIEKC